MGGATYYKELDDLYSLIKKIGGLSTDNSGINPNTVTAFGLTAVAEETPIVQLQFPYNINDRMVDTYTGGAGTVTHSTDGFAVLNTAATSDSYAEFRSHTPVKYNTGQGSACRFTAIWSSGRPGSKQLVGVGSTANGFYFGYNGENFGVCRIRGGVENWTYSSDWNKWTFPELNTSNGNVYEIKYQWLGYGAQMFYIEDPDYGIFREVHQIQYANTTQLTSVFNPTFYLRAYVENTDNNTDIELKVPSFAGFNEGKDMELGVINGLSNTKLTLSTQTPVIVIHNSTTYQGQENFVSVKTLNLSVATEGTKTATIKVLYNPVVTTSSGGSPVYNNYSTSNSVVQYATSSGITFTNGVELGNVSLAKTDSQILDGCACVYLNPGDTLAITAETAGINDFSASVRWKELF